MFESGRTEGVMLIRVMYQNYDYDYVDNRTLDRLIARTHVVKFVRPSENRWVIIGKDAVRGKGGAYRGPERRCTDAERRAAIVNRESAEAVTSGARPDLSRIQGSSTDTSAGKKSRISLWLALSFAALSAFGTASYIEYSYLGPIREHQRNKEPGIKPLKATGVSSPGRIATVKGPADRSSGKNAALGNVENGGVTQADEVRVERSPNEIETLFNRALSKSGLKEVRALVDGSYSATVVGVVRSTAEKVRALGIGKSYRELRHIKDSIFIEIKGPVSPRVDTAKMQRSINGALRRSGIQGINVEVRNDLTVVLTGRTASLREKQKALEIAKGFKEARSVKDVVFLIVL